MCLGQVLSDPERRRYYDQTGQDNPGQQPPPNQGGRRGRGARFRAGGNPFGGGPFGGGGGGGGGGFWRRGARGAESTAGTQRPAVAASAPAVAAPAPAVAAPVPLVLRGMIIPRLGRNGSWASPFTSSHVTYYDAHERGAPVAGGCRRGWARAGTGGGSADGMAEGGRTV